MNSRHLPQAALVTVAAPIAGSRRGPQRPEARRRWTKRGGPRGWCRRLPPPAMLTLLLIAAAPATMATAQGADRDAQRDSQRARADAAASTDRGSLISRNAFLDEAAVEDKAPEFTFSVAAPGFYNSNAEAANGNGTQTLEGNPEVRLAWSRSVAKKTVTLSALVDASSDRFVRSRNADGDSAYAQLRAQYSTDLDEDQAIAPFVGYSPSLAFAPTFSKETSTSHDLSLGFDKLYNFSPQWERFHGPTTSNQPGWSVGLTGTATRRFWDSPPSLYILTAAPSLTYNGRDPNARRPEAEWITSLGLNVSYRIYDRLGGFSRRDWLVNPVLTVELIPPLRWFQGGHLTEIQGDARKKALGRPKIDFQLAFTGLDSNKAAVPFHQWGIGPALKVAWSF